MNGLEIPTQDSCPHEQGESDASEGGEPLTSHSGEDDDEGQEKGDEYDVECQRGHVRGDGSSVAVGVEGGTSVLAKRIKPSSCHLDDLASRLAWTKKCWYYRIIKSLQDADKI